MIEKRSTGIFKDQSELKVFHNMFFVSEHGETGRPSELVAIPMDVVKSRLQEMMMMIISMVAILMALVFKSRFQVKNDDDDDCDEIMTLMMMIQ